MTKTPPHSLLPFVVVSLSGCSLIVDVLETDNSDSQSADAAIGEDGSENKADAGFAVCGPALSNTIAYFDAEMDEGRLGVHDRVSGTDLGESFRIESNEFRDAELAVAAGPSDCGNAFDLSQQEDRVLRVRHTRIADVRSVDLWVRVVAAPAGNKLVILGKDLLQRHNGDLQLSVFNNGADSHVIMRMQSLTPEEGVAYWCSPQITRDEWHHVALSFDGNDALLFVDGQTAAADVDIAAVYPDSSGCNQSTGSAKSAMPSMNDNDWLVGGSNSRSPNVIAENFFSGTLDELRFRSTGFTQAEAAQVYGQGR
jgi:hypothetical protein